MLSKIKNRFVAAMHIKTATAKVYRGCCETLESGMEGERKVNGLHEQNYCCRQSLQEFYCWER